MTTITIKLLRYALCKRQDESHDLDLVKCSATMLLESKYDSRLTRLLRKILILLRGPVKVALVDVWQCTKCGLYVYSIPTDDLITFRGELEYKQSQLAQLTPQGIMIPFWSEV